jgi:hypothetical protein
MLLRFMFASMGEYAAKVNPLFWMGIFRSAGRDYCDGYGRRACPARLVQMHEKEKEKLIRHHSKRLRQLGADEMNAPTPVCSPDEGKQTQPVSPPQRIRKTSPAKVYRRALGFRARPTRPQEYSIFKDPADAIPSQARPQSKRKSRQQRDITLNKPEDTECSS